MAFFHFVIDMTSRRSWRFRHSAVISICQATTAASMEHIWIVTTISSRASIAACTHNTNVAVTSAKTFTATMTSRGRVATSRSAEAAGKSPLAPSVVLAVT
jgi:hypothetical protein